MFERFDNNMKLRTQLFNPKKPYALIRHYLLATGALFIGQILLGSMQRRSPTVTRSLTSFKMRQQWRYQ